MGEYTTSIAYVQKKQKMDCLRAKCAKNMKNLEKPNSLRAKCTKKHEKPRKTK